MAYELDLIQLHLKTCPNKIAGETEQSWYLTLEVSCELDEWTVINPPVAFSFANLIFLAFWGFGGGAKMKHQVN